MYAAAYLLQQCNLIWPIKHSSTTKLVLEAAMCSHRPAHRLESLKPTCLLRQEHSFGQNPLRLTIANRKLVSGRPYLYMPYVRIGYTWIPYVYIPYIHIGYVYIGYLYVGYVWYNPLVIEPLLKTVLKLSGKSLYRLAKDTGISEQTLKNFMNGKTHGIEFETLDRICEQLKCQPGDLLIHKSNTKKAN